jgi:hypothetical protein
MARLCYAAGTMSRAAAVAFLIIILLARPAPAARAG